MAMVCLGSFEHEREQTEVGELAGQLLDELGSRASTGLFDQSMPVFSLWVVNRLLFIVSLNGLEYSLFDAPDLVVVQHSFVDESASVTPAWTWHVVDLHSWQILWCQELSIFNFFVVMELAGSRLTSDVRDLAVAAV